MLIVSFVGAAITFFVPDIMSARIGVHDEEFELEKKLDMPYRQAVKYESDHTRYISGLKAYGHIMEHFRDFGARLLFQKLKWLAIHFVSIFLSCFFFWRWSFKLTVEEMQRIIHTVEQRAQNRA